MTAGNEVIIQHGAIMMNDDDDDDDDGDDDDGGGGDDDDHGHIILSHAGLQSPKSGSATAPCVPP